MTTASDPSSATDRLKPLGPPSIDRGSNAQVTAARGAVQALSGQDKSRQNSASRSRDVARASKFAGCAARQASVSPPKTSVSAFGTSSRSSPTQIPQVQQLVKGFERASAMESSSVARKPDVASERDSSRSPSRAAARTASRRSTSRPKVAPPAPRKPSKLNDFSPDTQIASLNTGKGFPIIGPVLASVANEPSPNDTAIGAPTALRPGLALSGPEHVSGSVAVDDNNESYGNVAQTRPSMLAAQAALRNQVASDELPPPQLPQRRSRSSLALEGEAPKEIRRGRSLVRRPDNEHNDLSTGSSASYRPGFAQPPASPCERKQDNGSPRSGQSRKPTIPPRLSISSSSGAKYVDKRTGMTETALADAIVASSLATSRAASPSKKKAPAPPRPRRPSRSRSLFRRHQSPDLSSSRRGSPHRGMRQTLREHHSDDSADEKIPRKHKHFMKHPNKHHEGSRKRWKDRISERERKRYEGVWAANKGMFIGSMPLNSREDVKLETLPSGPVISMVVRDIWNRSRLPSDALSEIWNLVDRQGNGMLSRDEFVVGLWLIDQKLKGRKLPIRVSPTVWASVRYARDAVSPRGI